jgi:hypothetical protein
VVTACSTTVRPAGQESNVRLMVDRVKVSSFGDVVKELTNLSANSTRAKRRRQGFKSDFPLKSRYRKEINSLGTGGIIGTEQRITDIDHLL